MSDNDNKKSSGKDFIEETIKSKPVNKKRFFQNLVLAIIIAAAAAVVGAIVFVNMIPVAEKISGRETVKEKISITAEDASNVKPTSVATPEPTAEPTKEPAKDITTEPTSGPTDKPTEEPTIEPTEEPTTEPTEEPEKTSEDKDGNDTKDDKDDNTEKDTQNTEIIKEEIVYKDLTIENYLSLHDLMSEVAEKAQKSIVSVTGITSMMDYFENTYENSQQLTGVIVADSGEELYILTGYSVLEKVERIQVTFADGFIADAYFLRNDPDTGLAVIKVNDSSIPEETLEAISVAYFSTVSTATAGDTIMALGTLMGYNHSIAYGTVISTAGTFSASDCEYDLIATDIGAEGSTSGILVNLRGSVSGIIVPADKRNPDTPLTAFTTDGITGLIEALSNNESRPYIGIHGMDVTDNIAERTGIAKGILITTIENDSPAMLAGIMDRDILVKIEDTSVMTMEEYEKELHKYKPGDDIHIVTMRMGNEGYTEVEFDITVGEI